MDRPRIFSKKNPFAIDAPLPPKGPRRVFTIIGLVVGGLVALLVPVVFAVMVWGMLTGAGQSPAPLP